MRVVRRGVLGAAVAVAVAAAAIVIPAGWAGAAAGRTINFGNHTEVTVAAGWSAGNVKAGKLALTKSSPHAVVEVASERGETGTVTANDSAHLNQFTHGFGLQHVKVSGSETAKIPGSRKFTQAASLDYSGTFGGQTLAGLAVEYQNPKTGDAACAIVIAKQSDRPKLEKAVDQMFESIATNP
jgi:hypothetical protein